MTDDVLAERSLCNLFSRQSGNQSNQCSTCWKKCALSGPSSLSSAIWRTAQSTRDKGRMSCRKTTGQERGRKTQPSLYLDPYRIPSGSRAEPQIQSRTTSFFERRRLSSLPLLLPPSIFCSLTSFSLWSQLYSSSLQTLLVKYRWWPHYHYLESAAPWKKTICPEDEVDNKRHHFEKIQYGCMIRIKMLLMRSNSSSIRLLLLLLV